MVTTLPCTVAMAILPHTVPWGRSLWCQLLWRACRNPQPQKLQFSHKTTSGYCWVDCYPGYWEWNTKSNTHNNLITPPSWKFHLKSEVMQYNPTIAKQLSGRLNVSPHLGLILGTFLSIVLDCLQNRKYRWWNLETGVAWEWGQATCRPTSVNTLRYMGSLCSGTCCTCRCGSSPLCEARRWQSLYVPPEHKSLTTYHWSPINWLLIITDHQSTHHWSPINSSLITHQIITDHQSTDYWSPINSLITNELIINQPDWYVMHWPDPWSFFAPSSYNVPTCLSIKVTSSTTRFITERTLRGSIVFSQSRVSTLLRIICKQVEWNTRKLS